MSINSRIYLNCKATVASRTQFSTLNFVMQPKWIKTTTLHRCNIWVCTNLTYRWHGNSPFERQFTCCDASRRVPLRDYFTYRGCMAVVSMKGPGIKPSLGFMSYLFLSAQEWISGMNRLNPHAVGETGLGPSRRNCGYPCVKVINKINQGDSTQLTTQTKHTAPKSVWISSHQQLQSMWQTLMHYSNMGG